MFLPRTVSRDLGRLMGNSGSEEACFARLEKNPALILKFITQTAMSPSWYKGHFPLILRLVSVISKAIVSNTVNWEGVYKAVQVAVRYNPALHQGILLKTGKEETTSLYSTLTFISNCLALQPKWQDSSKDVLQDIYLSTHPGQFLHLYSTFFTNNFDSFRNYSLGDLINSLIQCRLWGYAKGILVLEDLVIARMNDFNKALMVLAFAERNQIPRVREAALSFTRNYPFYVQKSGDHLTYLAFSVSIKDHNFSDVATAAEMDIMVNTFLQHKNEYSNVNLEMTQILIEDQSLIPFLSAYEGECPLEVKKMVKCPREPLKGMEILVIDDRSDLKQEEVIGLMRAFDLIGIEFIECQRLSFSFFERISPFFPDMETLYFSRCENLPPEVLLNISRLFPRLGGLTVTDEALTSAQLVSFFSLSELDALNLFGCHLSLPETIPLLPNLLSLNVNRTRGEVNRIWEKAPHLIRLSVAYASGFDFERYPHAEGLGCLCLDVSQIRVSEGEIAGLKRYKRLKELKLIGKQDPSFNLESLRDKEPLLKITFDEEL